MQSDLDDHHRPHGLPHLGPSYNMDFDRHDYSNPYSSLNSLAVGNSAGMNDISALAAAASDQLYELERHEAFRRAEYELRHRQIAGSRSKSNGGSPAGTPANGLAVPGPYGFSSERERLGLHGTPAPGGGQIVYPISPAQPASSNHPAVPAGTLADPTYLVPPTCCHEDCHKSYRKRLKVAKQTQACPNCLSSTQHSNMFGNGNGGQGGGGSGSDHHSSNSNTPKDRSTMGSSEDLTKLGGGGHTNGGGHGGNSYALHHSLHQQLARLQQHNLALQKQQLGNNPYHRHSIHGTNVASNLRPYTLDLHAHKGLLHSAVPSRSGTPDSDDSSDDELVPITGSFDMNTHSPVLSSMTKMSLKQNRAQTAPTSPNHSRNPSRATSPVEGHSANSGKHGHASHQARDAKNRSHPYGGHSHYGTSSTTPNSPHFHPVGKSTRMSPPKMVRTLSGGHHTSASGGSSAHHRHSVEDILNASHIPPPPQASTRTLPPPNSNSSFSSSSVPSVSYSLSSQPTSTHVSPVTSRASSPVHNHSTSSHMHSHLAHSVRAAFGMTPLQQQHASASRPTASISPQHQPKAVQSPPHKLAPMGMSGNVHRGHGGHGGHDGRVSLPSLSRGSSPVHFMPMEVDGHA